MLGTHHGRRCAPAPSTTTGCSETVRHCSSRAPISPRCKSQEIDPSGWVAWGINPVVVIMGKTQSLIAFRHSNDSLLVLTYNVMIANNGVPLELSSIDYNVVDMAAEFKNNQITIFATWTLKNNQATMLHVWNTRAEVTGLVPGSHRFVDPNLERKGTIDLKSRVPTSTNSPHKTFKNRNGVLNVVSWGMLIPIRILTMRYLRPYKSADLASIYLHEFCQILGYVLGKYRVASCLI